MELSDLRVHTATAVLHRLEHGASAKRLRWSALRSDIAAVEALKPGAAAAPTAQATALLAEHNYQELAAYCSVTSDLDAALFGFTDDLAALCGELLKIQPATDDRPCLPRPMLDGLRAVQELYDILFDVEQLVQLRVDWQRLLLLPREASAAAGCGTQADRRSSAAPAPPFPLVSAEALDEWATLGGGSMVSAVFRRWPSVFRMARAAHPSTAHSGWWLAAGVAASAACAAALWLWASGSSAALVARMRNIQAGAVDNTARLHKFARVAEAARIQGDMLIGYVDGDRIEDISALLADRDYFERMTRTLGRAYSALLRRSALAATAGVTGVGAAVAGTYYLLDSAGLRLTSTFHERLQGLSRALQGGVAAAAEGGAEGGKASGAAAVVPGAAAVAGGSDGDAEELDAAAGKSSALVGLEEVQSHLQRFSATLGEVRAALLGMADAAAVYAGFMLHLAAASCERLEELECKPAALASAGLTAADAGAGIEACEAFIERAQRALQVTGFGVSTPVPPATPTPTPACPRPAAAPVARAPQAGVGAMRGAPHTGGRRSSADRAATASDGPTSGGPHATQPGRHAPSYPSGGCGASGESRCGGRGAASSASPAAAGAGAAGGSGADRCPAGMLRVKGLAADGELDSDGVDLESLLRRTAPPLDVALHGLREVRWRSIPATFARAVEARSIPPWLLWEAKCYMCHSAFTPAVPVAGNRALTTQGEGDAAVFRHGRPAPSLEGTVSCCRLHPVCSPCLQRYQASRQSALREGSRPAGGVASRLLQAVLSCQLTLRMGSDAEDIEGRPVQCAICKGSRPMIEPRLARLTSPFDRP